MVIVGVGRPPHRHLNRERRRCAEASEATAGARQSPRQAATMTTVIYAVLPVGQHPPRARR